jgi:integrase
MSALGQLAEEYLQMRRALGYKLTAQGRILRGFVRYLDNLGATRITVELALDFATQPAHASPIWWTRRLSVVRGFATYVQAIYPDTEVPPGYLLAQGAPRAVPYPYSSADIAALMIAARKLRPALHAATYETVIGLLTVSAMRVGELIALDRDDVDLAEGVLTIRSSKFGTARMVPIHPTTVDALRAYAQRRDELSPDRKSPSFFVSTVGTRLFYNQVREVFARLARQVGLEPLSPRCRPRLHDLRHRFACETLPSWYRSGENVAGRLPQLSTFMGHVKPKDTYWYLQATPELLSLAASRLERPERSG